MDSDPAATIEHAIMITTKETAALTSRLQQVEKALGLKPGFINVLNNVRDVENPIRGCFMAHKRALIEFFQTGKSNCLILEDDVYFLKPVDVSCLLTRLSKTNWEILYLGHRPVVTHKTFVKRTPEADILRVRTNDLHAAIISKSFARRTMEYTWQGKAIDVLMRNSSTNCYAFYPMPAVQMGEPFSRSFWNGLLEKIHEYNQYSKTSDFMGLAVRGVLFPFFTAITFLRLLRISLENRQTYKFEATRDYQAPVSM